MAELTIRMASNLIGYTFAEVTVPCPDDITPEEIARRHWEVNLRFLQEQEKISNEPVTEEQEAAITKAATETLTEKLPATKISEEKLALAASSGVGDVESTAHDESKAPWEEKPEATTKKPWENKPKFENLPDLFA